jgi:hypothetical protein
LVDPLALLVSSPSFQSIYQLMLAIADRVAHNCPADRQVACAGSHQLDRQAARLHHSHHFEQYQDNDYQPELDAKRATLRAARRRELDQNGFPP